MIFLSLRFYVKSILRILQMQYMPFQQIQRLSILIYLNFCTFWRLKLTKITKFRAPKIAKMAVLKCVEDKKSSKVFYVPPFFRAIWISRSAHSSHSLQPEKAEFWNVNKFKLWREGGGHRIFFEDFYRSTHFRTSRFSKSWFHVKSEWQKNPEIFTL